VNGYLGKIDAKDHQGDLVSAADGERPCAPHADRRSGPHLGDRISRQQGRDVRPKTEKFVEYPLRAHLSVPLRVDKNGEIWPGGMHTDRIVRFDQRPTARSISAADNTNIRSVWIDDTTSPPTFWTGSNHGAATGQGRAARLGRSRRKLAPASSSDGRGVMLFGWCAGCQAVQVLSLRA